MSAQPPAEVDYRVQRAAGTAARAFDLFEAFVEASGARLMEIQSSDALLAVMLHTYAHETTSEAIVFRDGVTTTLPANGAVVQPLTSDEEVARPSPSGRADPSSCCKSTASRRVREAFFFTTTRPYGDVYMEIEEPFRGRGFGAYLVQE